MSFGKPLTFKDVSALINRRTIKIRPTGFTLIELLVVVAIVAIISIVGVSIFRGITDGANNSRRQADIASISRAFEATYDPYTGQYRNLYPTDFSSGVIPTSPEGGTYFTDLSPGGKGFRVCAALNVSQPQSCGATSPTCSCKDSSQEVYIASASPSPSPSSGVSPSPSPSPSAPPPSPSPSPSPSPPSYLAGLVGYWKMDGTGLTEVDSAGSNNGTAVNGPTSMGGKIGSSRSFNGSNQYIDIPYSGININSLPISYQAWIRPTTLPAVGSYQTILSRGGYTNNGWAAYVNNNSSIPKVNGPRMGWNNIDNTLVTLAAGNWYHVVAVVNSTSPPQITLCVNNNCTSPTNLNTYIPPNGAVGCASNVLIGSVYTVSSPACATPGNFFNGQIDEVAVWNRLLTGTEIIDLYNLGQAGNPIQ